MLPEHLIELLTLFFWNIERVPLVEVKAEATKASLAVSKELWVERLQLVLLLDAEITLAHGNGKVGSSYHVVRTLRMSG